MNDRPSPLDPISTLALSMPDSMLPSSRPASPAVSVVICAYTLDRWDDTLAAIRSVLGQTLPPEQVIVVSDHNTQLFDRLRTLDLPIAVVENTQQRGLSGARNTGVGAATAGVVAFLDDDAVAEPRWLELLTRPYDDADVFATGGGVEPRWDVAPDGFPGEFNWVVGCSYTGMPKRRADVRNPIGANMSFRTSAVRAAGGFNHALGRVGTLPVGCEETELCVRVRRRAASGRVVYEPLAAVRHRVPETRTGWGYFARRCYSEGVSKAVLCRLEGAETGLSAERSYTFQTLPRGFVRGIADGLIRRDASGWKRAARIGIGLALTGIGFARGSIGGRTRTASDA